MITVEEARKISESVESEVTKKLKEELSEMIEKAARNGRRSCKFTATVEQERIRELLPGFAVEYHEERDPFHGKYSCLTISW